MIPGVPDRAELRRVPIRSRLGPARVLALIRGRPWPFLLTGDWAGGGAVLGSEPLVLAGADDDPFELWERLPELAGGAIENSTVEGAVGGGWFGWLGYGAGSRIEALPPQPPRPVPLPEAHLAYYDNVLRRDLNGQWWFEALVTPEREAALLRRLDEFRKLLSVGATGRGDTGSQSTEGRTPGPNPTPEADRVPGGTRASDVGRDQGAGAVGAFRPVAPGEAGHLAAVERLRGRIRSGELFQANLRLRLAAEMEGGEDLAALFTAAAERTGPAYGALFLAPWGGVASLSPELFLRRGGDLVETGPIKGTVRRPDDPAASESARKNLIESAKDAAEHVMIVDVARNDLGRVCVPGTVAAPSAPTAEPHPGLWHLVSRVRGRLRPGIGHAELLQATFPPCSVTGAPKIQAMHAIAGLEPVGREVFTGSIGYSSPVAGLEMNVAIRTFEARDGRIWIDVGGGIVADSDPERELEECLAKAGPLIEALGSRVEPAGEAAAEGAIGGVCEGTRAGSGGVPVRGQRADGSDLTAIAWALDEGRRRPDPACGVIETLAVRSGAPQHLDRHLDRIGRSLATLFGSSLPGDLALRTERAAAEVGEGALRLVAGADGTVEITKRALPPRKLPIGLAPFVLPGGLGAHKWADRRLVDHLAGDGLTPLLIDSDGSVLEAAWANVWIVEGAALLTPAADGRILPGVTRDRLLERGIWRGMSVREEEFGLDRLAVAGQILLSSSLAGLIPASFPDVLPGAASFDPGRR